MDWCAWRLLLSPARPAFAPLGLAGVGGFDAGLFVDGVVGADDAGIKDERTAELMGAVGRLMRRG